MIFDDQRAGRWLFVFFCLVCLLPSLKAQVITNAGFESPVLTANSYVYYTSMSPAQQSSFAWTGTGGTLLQNISSTWGLQPAPQGQQTVAIFGLGTVSQSIYFPTGGLYQVTWLQASRAGDLNPVWLQLDGANIQKFSTGNTAWTSNFCWITITSAGLHTLGFAGTASFQTVGLDNFGIAFLPFPQWQRLELSFTAAGSYTNPAVQVNLTTSFTGPTGQVYTITGFWNVADAGLAPKTGNFMVSVANSTNALYQHGGFLQASPDKHYLTYADGTPFFWLADTCWFTPGNLLPIDGGTSAQYATPSAFKQWVNKRQAQHFTVLQMACVWATMGANGSSPQSQMNSGTIDPLYWQQMDRYIKYANDAGIVPAMILDIWHTDLPNFTTNQLTFIWRYFMARYGADAVTFLIAGEYNAGSGSTLADCVTKVNAIGSVIKQMDPYQRACSAHPTGSTADGHQVWGMPWYGYIQLQGAHVGHDIVPPTWTYTQAWNAGYPVVEGEANYDGIWAGVDPSAGVPAAVLTSDVRATAYHAIQAGAAGFTYGTQGIWYPTQSTNDQTFWTVFGVSEPWWVALNYPGAAQMSHLRTFYESFSWWKLAPMSGAVNITGGPFSDSLQPLAKGDGSHQFSVWFPAGSGRNAAATLKLNVVNGAGTYVGKWFNPLNGQTQPVGSPLTAAGGVLPLPSRPDDNDWLLALNLTAGGVPVPLNNAGFESPWLRAGNFLYNPSGGGWTFNSNSGISGNASPFTSSNPSAPEGGQVGFVQMSGSFSQTVTLNSGWYQLSYSAAQRAGNRQTFNITMDGVVVGTYTSSDTTGNYSAYTTSPFQITSGGSHTLAFVGINSLGGDNTAFVDEVSLYALVAPEAPTGLTVSSGFQQAILNWNFASGAAQYKVKRSVTSGGPYVTIGTTASTVFTDTNLVNMATYYYVVSATNSYGEGADSAEASVQISKNFTAENFSFESTVAGAYTTNGWNTLPPGGAWSGGGSAFDTLNHSLGGHFSSVPDGTNWCYLTASGPISQDFHSRVNAGAQISLSFSQGRANSSLGNSASTVTATIYAGEQSWSTNFSDAALAQGAWRTNVFTFTPPVSGNLKIGFSNNTGNSFIDNVQMSVLPAPPMISAGLSGTVPVIMWGLDAEAFQLQSATNLTPPVVWKPIVSGMQTNAQGVTYAVPPGPEAQFFRMILP
jgi:hypothetical protein